MTYVNMNSFLKNYFFDTDFEKYFHENLISNRFKMNKIKKNYCVKVL